MEQKEQKEKKPTENLPVVSSQRELNDALKKYFTPDKYNLLVPPAMNFSSPYHRVALVPVFCDTAVDEYGNGRDIWKPGDSKEYTFHLAFLNKLAGTSNLIWTDSRVLVYEKSEEDGRVERIEHQVKWTVQKPDGSWRHGTTVGHYNYKEDQNRFSKRPKQVERRRNFASSLAESNAKTRAIFEALDGIYRQYSMEDLKKPFLVPRVVEDYRDLIGDDPEAKRMYLAHIFKQADKLSGVSPSATESKQIEAPAEQPQVNYEIPDAAYSEPEPAVPERELTIEEKKEVFKNEWANLGEKDRVEAIVELMGKKNYRTKDGKVPANKKEQLQLAWYLSNLPDARGQEEKKEKEPWQDVAI
jgi:hypothetical protein